jgi:hypothetical protein
MSKGRFERGIKTMDAIHELLDRGPIVGDGKNFIAPPIPGKDAVEWIVLPRTQLPCVEGRLQTIFAGS